MATLVTAPASRAPFSAEIIDIEGVLGPAAQPQLLASYARLEATTRAIVLDLTRLDRLIGGVGPLIVLLIAARRDHRRVLAFGPSRHVRDIFALTGLHRLVDIHETAEAAVAAAEGRPVPHASSASERKRGSP